MLSYFGYSYAIILIVGSELVSESMSRATARPRMADFDPTKI
jgi:hypothetical protein